MTNLKTKFSAFFVGPAGLIVLLGLYVVSRLPLLFAGVGSDNDTILLVISAQKMLEKGTYVISRHPGFPLFEHLCTLGLSFGSWFLINILSAVVSLMALYLFYQIMVFFKYSESQRRFLAVFFAIFSCFWINSASVIDYNWALCLILGAYLALLHKRWELSAVCLALAIGFRLSSGLFGAPFLFYMFKDRDLKRYCGLYFLLTGLLSAIFYSPCMLQYGMSFLVPAVMHLFKEMNIGIYTVHIFYNFYRFLGFFPGMVLGLGFIFYWRPFFAYLRSREIEYQVNMLVVILSLLVFLTFPMQMAYLSPIVPFALLMMKRVFPNWFMTFLFIIFLSHNFVTVVSLYDREEKRPQINFFEKGALFEDLKGRKYFHGLAKNLAGTSFPDHSIVFVMGVPVVFGTIEDQLFEEDEFEFLGQMVPVGRKKGSDQDIIYMNGNALLHPMIMEAMGTLKEQGYNIYIQSDLYKAGLLAAKIYKLEQFKYKDEWDIKVFEPIENSEW